MSGGGNHGGGKATFNGLIMIGFFALIIAGILLAIYAARYVPQTLSRLAGAVYLSSEAPKSATTTNKNTIEFPTLTPLPQAPAPTSVEPSRPTVTQATTTKPTTPRTGGPLEVPRTRVVQTGPRLYGLPDLAVTNVSTGYIDYNGNFIPSSRIPRNLDMYVTFIVRNLGTNISTPWRILVRVDGEQDAIAEGGILYPNGYQAFTLRVTNPRQGTNINTNITVDYLNAVVEPNENNNTASISVSVDYN